MFFQTDFFNEHKKIKTLSKKYQKNGNPTNADMAAD
jgi:hypothetical protein